MHIIRTNPYAKLARQLDGPAPVILHGDDLPDTQTFATWPGRGKISGTIVNGVGVNSPLCPRYGWTGQGTSGLKCAHLRPSTTQHVTFNAAAAQYGAGTAFTWLLAARLKNTAAQRNVLSLGSSTTGNNFRVFYMPAGDNFGLLSNRNGAGVETDDGAIGVLDEQCLVGISLAADGTLRIRQRTADGGTVGLAALSRVMTGTLTVDRFSLGGTILNGAFGASHAPLFARLLVCKPGVALDNAQLDKAFNLMEKELGCPLVRSATPESRLISIPSGVGRWYNASLQESTLPVVDDFSPNNDDGQANTVVVTSHEFDYQDNAAASITGTGYIIPAGNSSYTLIAYVRRVAGRTWNTTNNFNLLSSASLAVTSGIFGGLVQGHYNGVLKSSGYDAYANWAASKRHVVITRYDGTTGTLTQFVDDLDTPRATHTGLGARALAAEIHLGTYTGATGGWMHKAKDWAIFPYALSSAQMKQHVRAAAANAYVLFSDGDSNSALVTTDFLAPVGEGSAWLLAKRRVFPKAGLRTRFGANLGQSGRMVDTAGALAPVSLMANGATLDAAADANEWNVLINNIGSNDIHQNLYGGDVDAALDVYESYLDARIASGKWMHRIAQELPPSENSTYNSRINAWNAALPGFVTSGKLTAVIARPSSSPTDAVHVIQTETAGAARHWTPRGQLVIAERQRDCLVSVLPYYD